MDLGSCQQYLSKLFDKGEGLCFAALPMHTRVFTVDALEELAVDPPCFVGLNPLYPDRDLQPTKPWHSALVGRRADANVTAYRNILIEFDKVSLEEQMAMLIGFKVPYTTLTSSGGKSVHAVISLSEPLEDRPLYTEVFRAINAIFPDMDPSCKNPSRLTRLAGAVRPETGQLQELLDVRRRVSQRQLFNWLAQHEETIMAARAAETRRAAVQAECTERGELRPDTWAFLRGEVGTRGSRHNRLYAACCEMLECGIPYDEALALIEQGAHVHGISAEPGREDEALNIVNHIYGI